MNREIFIITMGNVLFDDDYFTDQQKKHITKLVAKACKQTEEHELTMMSHVIVDSIDTREERLEVFKELGVNFECTLTKLINKVKGLEIEQNIEKK